MLYGVVSSSTFVNQAVAYSARISARTGEVSLVIDTIDTDALTTPSAPTAATVGAASAKAFNANAAARYRLFINTSSNWISLGLGQAAVFNSGITIAPNGGAYEMTAPAGNLYLGDIYAIAAGAGSNLAFQESA
jgi:hypothetical protein